MSFALDLHGPSLCIYSVKVLKNCVQPQLLESGTDNIIIRDLWMWVLCSSSLTNRNIVILSSQWLPGEQQWCKLALPPLPCFLWLSRKETVWDWFCVCVCVCVCACVCACVCVCVCQGWTVWSLSHAQSVMRREGTDSATKKTIRYFFGRPKRSFQTWFIGRLFALSCSNTVHVLQRSIWTVFIVCSKCL